MYFTGLAFTGVNGNVAESQKRELTVVDNRAAAAEVGLLVARVFEQQQLGSRAAAAVQVERGEVGVKLAGGLPMGSILRPHSSRLGIFEEILLSYLTVFDDMTGGGFAVDDKLDRGRFMANIGSICSEKS